MNHPPTLPNSIPGCVVVEPEVIRSTVTRPVCEETYHHRLRKTAATNWLRSGFNLVKIKNWHKSLEVTEIYLDSEMHDPEEKKKLGRAGKF
jgi:hypothetical protein